MSKVQDNTSAPGQAAKVSHFLVDEQDEGQRLDNFLARRLKGLPRSRLYKAIRRGEVRVNGGRARPSRRLAAKDQIRVPPVTLKPTKEPSTRGSRLSGAEAFRLSGAEAFRLSGAEALPLLYEDDHLLIVDKPAGLAVHGGSGISLGLIEKLRRQRPEDKRLELAHRLDRDTSGCLMVAKKAPYLRLLQDALRRKRIRKRYLALVHGLWPKQQKIIDTPLLTKATKEGEKITKPNPAGKEAVSRFRVLLASDQVSLLEVELPTGRTHQIRVHTQLAGHPLVGDAKYGDPALDTALAKGLTRSKGKLRLMLHAASLEIPPLGTEASVGVKVTSPLEQRFQACLKQLLELTEDFLPP